MKPGVHNEIILIILSLSTTALAAGGKRQEKAHIHGQGALNGVVDQGTVELDLDLPMDDVVGFERKPKNDAEKKGLEGAMTILKSVEKGFAFPAAAQCVATSQSADYEIGKGHASIEAKYTMTCKNPSALDAIEVLLFSRFPRMKELKAQFVTPTGQKSFELSLKNTKVTL